MPDKENFNCVLIPETPPLACGLQIQNSVGIGSYGEETMWALTNGDNPGFQNGVLVAVEDRGGDNRNE